MDLLLLALGLAGCTGQTPVDSADSRPIDDTGDSDTSVDSDTDTSTPYTPVDADDDTYYDCSTTDQAQFTNIVCGDCNDSDASVHPGASDSTQDGVDNNCNGSIDEGYVAPDPVVDIIFDGEPAVVQVENIRDITNGLNIALGDLDDDGADDLVAVATDWGWASNSTGEGKAYGFLSAMTSLPAGETKLISSADIQYEGGQRWAGLFSAATADADHNGRDELYLGFADSDAVVAIDNVTAGPSINFEETWSNGTIPSGLDATVVEGNGEGIGASVLNIGDVDGDGSVSLLASGGDFCGILNLADFVRGSFMVYSEVTTHELTQPYYDGTVCEDGWTASGDITGDGKSELLFGTESDGITTGTGGWIVSSETTWPYNIDLPRLEENDGSLAITWVSQHGTDEVVTPVVGDLNGDGFRDFMLGGFWTDNNGDEKVGALNFVDGATFAGSIADGTIQTGDNITAGYDSLAQLSASKTSDFNLADFPKSNSFYGDRANAYIGSANAVWSDPVNYPGITLVAMGAAAYAGGTEGAIFISDYTRLASAVNHETIVSEANGDTKITGDTGDYLGGPLFGDLNGDGIPDLVATAQGTGRIKIWYGREVHQSERSN